MDRTSLTWMPIETVPLRDAVVVHHPAHWTRLACKHEDGKWIHWPSYDELAYTPTHWSPIPDPPA